MQGFSARRKAGTVNAAWTGAGREQGEKQGKLQAGASNLVPVMFSAVGRLPDGVQAVSLVAVTALGYAGMLCGPALIGFLALLTGLVFASAVVAVMLVGVGLAARIVRTRPKRMG